MSLPSGFNLHRLVLLTGNPHPKSLFPIYCRRILYPTEVVQIFESARRKYKTEIHEQKKKQKQNRD